MAPGPAFLGGVAGPSGRRRLFVVPLVVLSVVLVALVVAIVVVVVVRGGARSDPAAVEVDRCVVGAWQVAEHREDVALASFGTVHFTGEGAGASVRLNDDGTGVTDYGTRTRFEGVAAGHTIGLEVSGKVTYRYAAARGTVSFRDLVPGARGAVYLDGVRSAEVPFTGSTDPASYECSGDHMVFRTDLYETTFTRTS